MIASLAVVFIFVFMNVKDLEAGTGTLEQARDAAKGHALTAVVTAVGLMLSLINTQPKNTITQENTKKKA